VNATEREQTRTYELQLRNRRLERVCEQNATIVTMRLAARRAKEKSK
jgi:hypothetical protein